MNEKQMPDENEKQPEQSQPASVKSENDKSEQGRTSPNESNQVATEQSSSLPGSHSEGKSDGGLPANEKPDESQTSQVQSVQPKSEQAKTREKAASTQKTKPSFDTFLADLTDMIRSESKKDELTAIMRLMKRGYEGDVQPDQADKVFDLVKHYDSADRLAVQLATALPQRPSAIARTIRNRLRSWMKELVGYPVATPGEDRLFELADWINEGDSAQKSEGSLRYPPEWVRMALACLTTESELTLRGVAAHRLLKAFAGEGKPDSTRTFQTDCQGFLKEAGKLISAKTISVGKVAASLQFGHPLEALSRQDRDALSQALLETENAADKLRKLGEEKQRLQEQLEDAQSRVEATQRELDETRTELENQHERLMELEQHWETASEQRLSQLRHQVTSNLGHDLQEARLALDRETPNVEMGLKRIRKVEEMIRAMDT